MPSNDKRKFLPVFLHIGACMFFLSLPVFFSPDFDFSFRLVNIRPFQKDFLTYVLLVLFFYLNVYIFLPEFFFRRRYFLFVLMIIVSYLLVVLLPWGIIPSQDFSHFHKQGAHSGPPREHFRWIRYFKQHFFQFALVFIFSMLLKIIDRWKQSEKEKMNAELAFLKAQINPHFLFNTLNSIYALALGKSDKTAYAVVKLSGMMRYVISDANRDLVPLEKELGYIGDYIELQKMRSGEDLNLQYVSDGDTAGLMIAPLMLIPFIENAFKHGVNTEEDTDIRISIVIKGSELVLAVSNRKVSKAHHGEDKSGLGIENTRSRLQLVYPFRHELSITDNEKDFIVYLKLRLE
jgi:hypothetical protein